MRSEKERDDDMMDAMNELVEYFTPPHNPYLDVWLPLQMRLLCKHTNYLDQKNLFDRYDKCSMDVSISLQRKPYGEL